MQLSLVGMSLRIFTHVTVNDCSFLCWMMVVALRYKESRFRVTENRQMRNPEAIHMRFVFLNLLILIAAGSGQCAEPDKHLLYVAVPGIRDLTNLGGEGIVVLDIDHQHSFVKRIATP